MARLIDEIRAGARIYEPGPLSAEAKPEWQDDLELVLYLLKNNPRLPVLLIDNVAEYYWLHMLDEHVRQKKDINFPNLAPPYEKVFWVEYTLTAAIRDRNRGVNMRRLGVMVHVATEGAASPEIRWELQFYCFVQQYDGIIVGPYGVPLLHVNKAGGLAGAAKHGWSMSGWMEPLLRGPAEEYNAARGQLVALLVALQPVPLAICFLHCKNVATVDNSMPAPLAKKYHTRTGSWPTRYRTLVIEPLKEILKHEGGIEKVGLERALHICRGHFASYKETGPGLFGKGIYGDVWIPQYLRGVRKPDQEGDPPREIQFKLDEKKLKS
jgi:hypothetical protein